MDFCCIEEPCKEGRLEAPTQSNAVFQLLDLEQSLGWTHMTRVWQVYCSLHLPGLSLLCLVIKDWQHKAE